MFFAVIAAYVLAVAFAFCGVGAIIDYAGGVDRSSMDYATFLAGLGRAMWPLAVAMLLVLLTQTACLVEHWMLLWKMAQGGAPAAETAKKQAPASTPLEPAPAYFPCDGHKPETRPEGKARAGSVGGRAISLTSAPAAPQTSGPFWSRPAPFPAFADEPALPSAAASAPSASAPQAAPSAPAAPGFSDAPTAPSAHAAPIVADAPTAPVSPAMAQVSAVPATTVMNHAPAAPSAFAPTVVSHAPVAPTVVSHAPVAPAAPVIPHAPSAPSVPAASEAPPPPASQKEGGLSFFKLD